MLHMEDDVARLLDANEEVIALVSVAKMYASTNDLPMYATLQVLLTEQRYVILERRGTFKKRLEMIKAYPLNEFTLRINTSEGPSFGGFHYALTLFRPNDETVSALFVTKAERDAFKDYVNVAMT